MRKTLFLCALAVLPALPLRAQDAATPIATTAPLSQAAPLTLKSAVETLASYKVTKDNAPEAVLAAFDLVSKSVATPDKLPHEVKARLDELLAQRQPVPSPKAQIKLNDPLDFALVRYENRLIDNTPAAQVTPYRGASEFPGAVGAGANPISRTLEIDTAIRGWHSLGLYAAPGAKITVTIRSDEDKIKARELSVRIGSHADVLYTAPGGRNGAQRLPSISRVFPIEGQKTLAANAAGGLVYIMSPQGTVPGKLTLDHNDTPRSDRVRVTIDGAVMSPLFEQGKTDVAAWKAQLAQSKAPWAEVGSDWLVLTMPIEDARAIADPELLMNEWNGIAQNNYRFIGYPANHRPIRPERMVSDVQLSVGAAHAGYPIMMPLAWAKRYSDPQQLKTGNNWGLYHELGHNFQDPDWSFAGNGEVSNNVMIFLARKNFGVPMWDEKSFAAARATLKERLAQGKNPWETVEGYSDNFSKLLFWYDMVNELGFEPLQTAFAETQRNAPPKDENEKRLLLMTRISRAAGKNLAPYFEKWGILQNEKIPEDVAKLPVWLPVALSS